MTLQIKIRVWETKVPITGWLEGSINDWPSHIQDGIYAAMEVVSQREQLPITIVHSSCEIAYNDDGKQDGAFIHIILSEIVARDMRFTSEETMKKHFREYLAAHEGTKH